MCVWEGGACDDNESHKKQTEFIDGLGNNESDTNIMNRLSQKPKIHYAHEVGGCGGGGRRYCVKAGPL